MRKKGDILESELLREGRPTCGEGRHFQLPGNVPKLSSAPSNEEIIHDDSLVSLIYMMPSFQGAHYVAGGS